MRAYQPPLPIPKIFLVVYLLKLSSECLVSYDPHFPANDGTNKRSHQAKPSTRSRLKRADRMAKHRKPRKEAEQQQRSPPPGVPRGDGEGWEGGRGTESPDTPRCASLLLFSSNLDLDLDYRPRPRPSTSAQGGCWWDYI